MPYIKQERRPEVDEHGAKVMSDLSYAICREINTFLKNNSTELRFDIAYGVVLGALDSARLSYWNDVLQPYEEQAKDRNGKVFTY